MYILFFYFFCEEKNASHVPLRTQHENIITSSCKLTCNDTLSLNLNWKLNYSFGFCLITNSVLVLDRVEGHHLQNQITLTVCVFFEIVFLFSFEKQKIIYFCKRFNLKMFWFFVRTFVRFIFTFKISHILYFSAADVR